MSSLYGLPPFCAGDMPISLEQWRAAVGRWVARIQRTLVIRRGVKRAPSSHESSPSLSGQSHNGEKKLTVKRKGRKKHKDDSHGGSTMTAEFYDSLILPAAQTCPGRHLSKDVSDRNLVARLKELFGFTGLGTVVAVIMILLIRSRRDVEANPGPVERGRWLYFRQFTSEMTEAIFGAPKAPLYCFQF